GVVLTSRSAHSKHNGGINLYGDVRCLMFLFERPWRCYCWPAYGVAAQMPFRLQRSNRPNLCGVPRRRFWAATHALWPRVQIERVRRVGRMDGEVRAKTGVVILLPLRHGSS